MMLDLNMISLTYIRESLGIWTSNLNAGMQLHKLNTYELGGNIYNKGEQRQRFSNSNSIERVITQIFGKSRETKRIMRHLLDKMSFRSLGISNSLPQGFTALAQEDLHDVEFVKKAVEHTLRALIPGVVLPDVWTFKLTFASDYSFIVGTTLDFDAYQFTIS